MKKLLAWVESHPVSTVFVLLISALWTVIALANGIAEYRWRSYSNDARTRGVKLTLAEFETPKIPDETNFAELPTLRTAFAGQQRPMQLPATGKSKTGFSDPKKGVRIDWNACRQYFVEAGYLEKTTESAPADVLAALEYYRPQFDDWGQWRTRPHCRFPLAWNAGMAMPLPHLATFQDAARLFRLRMNAHLALGDSPAAYADFREGLQAYHALKEEPTLIAGLVQISALSMLLSSVGEGLADHSWADPQLQQIEADLSPIQVWDDYRRAFSSERGFGNSMYDQVVSTPSWQRIETLGGIPLGFPAAWLVPWIPKCVYRRNQLRHNRYLDEILARVNPEATRFDPDVATTAGPDQLEGLDEYRYFLFRLSAPIFSELDHRFVLLHSRVAQARLAGAAERFRLRNGNFPETLAALVPGFLAAVPADPYSGQPMIYRRKDQGGFELYSVGKNRVDDGGASDLRRNDGLQKDDVWLHSPSLAAPARD